MFVRTTAINKILKLEKRVKVIQGGSSAGKTFGILPILIDKAAKNPGEEISVIAESIPHLKRGAMKDFLKIMRMTGRFFEDRWNISDRKYTFANGSFIEFYSPESVLGARRTTLYINEANYITYEDYHQLAIRTSGDIYLDYNPSDEFWVHTEVLTEPDSELLILTYKDNEALPQNVINDFGKALRKAEEEQARNIKGYWSNWVKVYIHGEIGSLQGTVFNFHVCDELPKERKVIGIGLDWGFSADPTAIIEVSRFDGALYLNELLYENGLTNSDLIAKMKALNIRGEIIADSAEPKSIEDLRRAGFNVLPAKKGADSIRASIDKLQSHTIYVTKASLNLIKEFRMYKWITDISGKPTGEPIDAYNHGIDSVRYVALNKLMVATEYFKTWL
jgi:phage terminase large subunit